MKLRFIGKREEASGVWSYDFEPFEHITWVAGQSIRLEVGDDERRFSISSAPHEGVVTITTRLSESGFKADLNQLSRNDLIEGYAVEGNFIWNQSHSPALFIAAGIGITPFRAILNDLTLKKNMQSITLLYGSATSDIVFKNTIDAWAREHEMFAVQYVIGKRITIEDIMQRIDANNRPTVYISGPSGMVNQLFDELSAHGGINPGRILKDNFTGYVDTF